MKDKPKVRQTSNFDDAFSESILERNSHQSTRNTSNTETKGISINFAFLKKVEVSQEIGNVGSA